MTEWVFRQTPIFFTFSLLMGALAALAHSRGEARAAEARGYEADAVVDPIEEEMLVTDEI
jgi:hypothetical protein